MRTHSHPLVIGLGNEYRSDDAVGQAVARRLKADADGVDILEETGECGALMESWGDADYVILVDAVESGAPPGTIQRFDANVSGIPSEFFHCSAHSFGVSESIELARALGRLPSHLIVYGIEGKTYALGTELSPEVRAAADEVVRRVRQELEMESRPSKTGEKS